jgi:opacity protein-like surface antigen
MKKFLIIFCAAFLASTVSNATGLYVGADLLQSMAKSTAKNSSLLGPQNGDVVKQNQQMNYGVNAGFRLDVLNLLASVEGFYDNLNNRSQSFNSTTSGGKINFDNRYGARANLGFAILPRITPFITYGLSRLEYSAGVNASSSSKMGSLYGVGLLVDLPLGFSVKAAYDYQPLDLRYQDVNGSNKMRTHLSTARIGVAYNF